MSNIREKLDDLYCGLSSLAIFRGLLKDPVSPLLQNLLRSRENRAALTSTVTPYLFRNYINTALTSANIFSAQYVKMKTFI